MKSALAMRTTGEKKQQQQKKQTHVNTSYAFPMNPRNIHPNSCFILSDETNQPNYP